MNLERAIPIERIPGFDAASVAHRVEREIAFRRVENGKHADDRFVGKPATTGRARRVPYSVS